MPRRSPVPGRATRRPRAVAVEEEDLPATSGRAGLGGLLRSPSSVLGGLSGIDGATRSLERLSRAAERGADFLERLETEVGWERAVELVDRLEGVLDALDGIHDMLADLHDHVLDEEAAAAAARRRSPSRTPRGSAPGRGRAASRPPSRRR